MLKNFEIMLRANVILQVISHSFYELGIAR